MSKANIPSSHRNFAPPAGFQIHNKPNRNRAGPTNMPAAGGHALTSIHHMPGFDGKVHALITFLVCVAPLLLGGCSSVATPKYTVLERREGYEVRQYNGYLLAETEVGGSYKESLNQGFRILFDFISGNNEGKIPIEMTAPVLQEAKPGPEKIEMTAPVLTESREGRNVIAFVMPAKYTMQTLPRPGDPRVTIRETPPRKVAVRAYSWYATEERVRKETDRLRSLLAEDGIRPASSFRSAQYNPPWTLPFLRRNEIMVDL